MANGSSDEEVIRNQEDLMRQAARGERADREMARGDWGPDAPADRPPWRRESWRQHYLTSAKDAHAVMQRAAEDAMRLRRKVRAAGRPAKKRP